MKEHREASKILWRNCMSIQQLHLREYANGLIDSWNDDKSDSLSISVGSG